MIKFDLSDIGGIKDEEFSDIGGVIDNDYRPETLSFSERFHKSPLEALANNPVTNQVLVTGQAIPRMAAGIYDAVRELPYSILRTGASDDPGDPLGNLISRNVPEMTPSGSGSSYDIANFLAQAAPILGGLGRPAASMASKLLHKITTGLKIAPESMAKSTLSGLTKGKSGEKLGEELAGRIGEAYYSNKYPIARGYQYLENNFGEMPIYSKSSSHGYGENLGKPVNLSNSTIAEKFHYEPTYKNARNYISQLKEEKREIGSAIKKGNDIQNNRNELSRITLQLKNLENETHSFLKKQNPSASEMLSNLNHRYATEVQPYKIKAPIRNLVQSMESGKVLKGAEIKFNSLINALSNPSSSNAAHKIMQDIGAEGMRNIIARRLGGAKNAKSFINRFNKLDESDISSYITPELRKDVLGIEKALKHKKNLKHIAKASALGAGVYGSYHGLSHLLGSGERYSHGGSE